MLIGVKIIFGRTYVAILFKKDIFIKENVAYASFRHEKKIFWGRKTKYTVKDLPFSVMEVFLVK